MKSKVLIVDDDSEFRSELRDLLMGYDVTEASSGEEALQILKRANEIGVVLMDVQMPGAGGIETLTRIKKTDPNLHIIIATGYGSKDIAIEALKAHADNFLEKPMDPQEIVDAVEEALGRADYGSADPETVDIDAKIAKVKNFVERNCFKKTSLSDAARSVFLSPKYLSRVFREKAKQTFSQFKIGVKIARAKELLKKNLYNVDHISEKLGYENTESFIRQFKKLTGKTPTEFRKKFHSGKKPRR